MRIPAIKGNTEGADALQGLLHHTRGVNSARANSVTGSVVVHYDPVAMNSSELLRVMGDYGHAAGNPRTLATRQTAPAPSLGSIPKAFRCSRKALPPGRKPKPVQNGGTGAIVASVAPWLLKKTLEIALERSLVLLVAAVL